MEIAIAVLAILVVFLALALAFLLRRRRAPARVRARSAPVSPPPSPGGLAPRIRALFGAGEVGDDAWSRLEELLVRADVGPAVARRIVKDVRERYAPGADPTALVAQEIVRVLGEDAELDLPEGRLAVVMVVGINGSGKTTTIGKLAARLARDGRSVSLAGSDTFRAAASEQLGVWAERAGAHLVAQARGADPGSVAFDAVRSAQARGANVLIVDTAGRLHTKTPLMDELRKVRRVLERAAGQTPDETLLVLDATTGQNGVAQATVFTEAVEVSGVALAKLDGTAKGGVVLAVRERLGVPVKLVGTGEGVEDLEPFDARAFAARMLGG
ncbi:MAG TPA: signal recognition particle-docking protein FtsY [Actinomycetota bacterium]|nr:signal recognition particle-docking protein FtsY [Actinomycetota bacterium]